MLATAAIARRDQDWVLGSSRLSSIATSFRRIKTRLQAIPKAPI